jgi:hypothetical protein
LIQTSWYSVLPRMRAWKPMTPLPAATIVDFSLMTAPGQSVKVKR